MTAAHDQAKAIDAFRVNEGAQAASGIGTPPLLLNHPGAKSAVSRVNPVG